MYMLFKRYPCFIALIHPIQWTLAYPVSADRPAKHQKKTSCVSTGQAGPVLCTRQVACSTSFLSRQRDVIASFSFGACVVYTNFLSWNIFWDLLKLFFRVCFHFLLLCSRVCIDHFDLVFGYGSSCLPLYRSMEVVATSWLASTAIVSAHIAEKRVRGQIRALPRRTVTLVTFCLRNNVYSCPLRLTD